MRISKTALSLLVCIALIFSLAACGGSGVFLGQSGSKYTSIEDNFFGRRFNLTIKDFCKKYGPIWTGYNDKYREEQGDTTGTKTDISEIVCEENFVKLDEVNAQTGYEVYQIGFGDSSTKDAYYLALKKAPGSDYISEVYIQYYNKENVIDFVRSIIIPSVVDTVSENGRSAQYAKGMSVGEFTYDEENNIVFQAMDLKDGTFSFAVAAMSQEKYDEIYGAAASDVAKPPAQVKKLLDASLVKCADSDITYFLRKIGDSVFYIIEDTSSLCLMSVDVNSSQTKQIAYLDNSEVQGSSTKLLFKGSESGYDMQYMTYDIASGAVSKIENGTYSGGYTLVGNYAVYSQYDNGGSVKAIDLNTNGINVVYSGQGDCDVIADRLSESIFYYTVNGVVYAYHIDSQSSEFLFDPEAFSQSGVITSGFLSFSREDDDNYATFVNGKLYAFIKDKGVYTLDGGNLVMASQYPANQYEDVAYEPERRFYCSGSAIYYRAENPHSELIIKLEDGKETVINTPSALNTTLINCTDSIKSNVLAINDDGLWCAANDEQYSYDEKGSRITSTNYYLLCIDSDGDIKNAVGMEKTEIIAIDGGYVYCIGRYRDSGYGIFKISVEDMKVS